MPRITYLLGVYFAASAFRAAHDARIGFDDARVRGERLAADQTGAQTGLQHALEHHAESVALAEPAMPRLREAGTFGHVALEAKAAEPAIGQIEMHLLDQPTLRANTVKVADQQ